MITSIILIVIALVIGIIIGRISLKYTYDGKIIVETNESGIKVFSLEIDEDPDDLEKRNRIIFKVVSKQDISL